MTHMGRGPCRGTQATVESRARGEGRTMKLAAIASTLLVVRASGCIQEKEMSADTNPNTTPPGPTSEDIRAVSPALERYMQVTLQGDLWNRPGLTPRDRSLVTLAALVARNQTAELPRHLNLALDNGVKPGEVSEIITHLAFYSGWGNAMPAVAVAKDVFAQRNIGIDQLPSASPTPLPLDKAAEEKRAATVAGQFGSVAPGLVQYTTDLLFNDL